MNDIQWGAVHKYFQSAATHGIFKSFTAGNMKFSIGLI